MSGFYSREAILRSPEAREARESNPPTAAAGELTLDQISVDAPADDAVLTVWNGERWVAYDRWLATAPITYEESVPNKENMTLAPARKAQVADSDDRQIELPMAPEAANG